MALEKCNSPAEAAAFYDKAAIGLNGAAADPLNAPPADYTTREVQLAAASLYLQVRDGGDFLKLFS